MTPHFVSDKTAKGVLRGLVRQMAEFTPSEDRLISQVRNILQSSRSSSLKAVNKIKSLGLPFSLATGIHKLTDGHAVMMYLVRFVDSEHGWNLRLDAMHARVTSTRNNLQYDQGWAIYNGHAIERLFQRASIIGKDDVLNEIKFTTPFIQQADFLDAKDRPSQVVLPTKRGVFACIYDKESMQITAKTFIEDGNPKFDRVKKRLIEIYHGDLKDSVKGKYDPNIDYFRTEMKKMLQDETWLMEPYETPRDDQILSI